MLNFVKELLHEGGTGYAEVVSCQVKLPSPG